MKRLALALLAAALPTAVSAAVPADLIPAFRKACRPAATGGLPVGLAGDYGLITGDAALGAILKVYAIDPVYLLRQTPEKMAERAVVASRRAPGDDGKLAVMVDLVEEWTEGRPTPILPLESGGLRIVRKDGAAGLKGSQALTKLVAGDTGDLTILCRDPQAPAPPAPLPQSDPEGEGASPPPDFVLVKTTADLSQKEFEKKSFAEFAYADDRQKRVQTYGLNLAAGLIWPEIPLGDTNGVFQHLRPAVYVAYERKGENDPVSDSYVNNLNFGGRLSGDVYFHLGESLALYYALSAQYETDDDFKARAYGAELRVDPPLPWVPGHRVFYALPAPASLDAEAYWGLDLIADWSQVDDPGEKKNLAGRAEYARLGYDAGFKARFGPSQEDVDWRLQWSFLYQVRDGQTEDGGDAQLVTSSLVLLPNKQSNLSFGLSYERGENLQSFVSSEVWKLVLGLRY